MAHSGSSANNGNRGDRDPNRQIVLRNTNGQIIPGNTILDKLLNQLSQADREFVLRLMAELGIPANDPTHPFLVAVQYYVSLLRDIPEQLREIPEQIRVAAKDSLREALTTYGTIQTRIDESTEKIDGIRVQWNEDGRALLSNFGVAFDAAEAKKLADYKVQLDAINELYAAKRRESAEDELKQWADNCNSTKNIYLKDVLRQGLIWASGAMAIALMVLGGSTYWGGWQKGNQQGRDEAIQDIYRAFGGKAKYDCAKAVMTENPNVDAICKRR